MNARLSKDTELTLCFQNELRASFSHCGPQQKIHVLLSSFLRLGRALQYSSLLKDKLDPIDPASTKYGGDRQLRLDEAALYEMLRGETNAERSEDFVKCLLDVVEIDHRGMQGETGRDAHEVHFCDGRKVSCENSRAFKCSFEVMSGMSPWTVLVWPAA